MTRRLLVSVFGSAGDLFPVVPVILRLRELGHDVRAAVPRALSLYLRAAGVPLYALGDGSELRVLHDPEIVSTRFGGWASWHRLARDYIGPHLGADVDTLTGIVDGWRPDAVVATSFAAAARVAARRAGVPLVAVSIYPQHQRRLPATRGFGRDLRRAVGRAVPPAAHPELAVLAWGAGPETVVLHDPALEDGSDLPGEVVGFPYWDGGATRPGDLERVEGWLDGSSGPVVLVTAGSFLGTVQHATGAEAVAAIGALGVRTLLVGPRRSGDQDLDGRPDVLAAGFVPLSRVARRVDAVVHHGGIGTTFAALRAGRPAVVVPQAFDQCHNARLVERAGVGIDAGPAAGPAGRRLPGAVERVLADGALATRATEVAAALVPSDAATEAVVDRVLQASGEGRVR